MTLFTHTKPHILISDIGQVLIDTTQEVEEDQKPYEATIIYLPDGMTLEDCQNKYLEREPKNDD